MKLIYAIPALALVFLTPAVAAQDEILPQTLPVPLNETDPQVAEIGDLIYRGGLKIEPGEDKIGGISGLEWHDNALWAVSDDGRWWKIVPDESSAELRDIFEMQTGTLRDLDNKKLKRKREADAEAIVRRPEGGWMIAFEQDHRIWQYEDLSGRALAVSAITDDPADLVHIAGPNKGIETLAGNAELILICGEGADHENPNCNRISAEGSAKFALTPPPLLAEHGGVPTDAACADDGTCYVLFRSYKAGYGNRAAIIELTGEGPKTLGVLDRPFTLDNFEGLAVREQYGKRYLYLVSDDNFYNCFESKRDNCQNTLLLKFEIKSDEAAAPQVSDAPEPDVNYETVAVVLETEMGPITISLEIERAPITAGNFLRYVEEGRFDGTAFYRAMSLNREPKPNGLLQGGTQFDPKRILPGIPHEPTTQTGLSHTNGALSMAMGEPGTANGDFSIMLQDQIGLDARPEADEAIWRNGYAVFGYVTEGMEVVAAIHGSGNDPTKGQGAMKGQMLSKPVKILKARKVAKPASK